MAILLRWDNPSVPEREVRSRRAVAGERVPQAGRPCDSACRIARIDRSARPCDASWMMGSFDTSCNHGHPEDAVRRRGS